MMAPGPLDSAKVTDPGWELPGGTTAVTMATCPTAGGLSHQTMMSPGCGRLRWYAAVPGAEEGISIHPLLCA